MKFKFLVFVVYEVYNPCLDTSGRINGHWCSDGFHRTCIGSVLAHNLNSAKRLAKKKFRGLQPESLDIQSVVSYDVGTLDRMVVQTDEVLNG